MCRHGLDGNYPTNTDSRLVSATVVLPTVAGPDRVHFRFQQWFTYGSGDLGQVQVSAWDPVNSVWGAWVNEGTAVSASSGGWSLKDVDLTAYAGATVRVSLLHAADAPGTTLGAGWYVDDVTIIVF